MYHSSSKGGIIAAAAEADNVNLCGCGCVVPIDTILLPGGWMDAFGAHDIIMYR